MSRRDLHAHPESKEWPTDLRTRKKVPYAGYQGHDNDLKDGLDSTVADLEGRAGQEGILGILVVEGENPDEITVVTSTSNPFKQNKKAVAQALMRAGIEHLGNPDIT